SPEGVDVDVARLVSAGPSHDPFHELAGRSCCCGACNKFFGFRTSRSCRPRGASCSVKAIIEHGTPLTLEDIQYVCTQIRVLPSQVLVARVLAAMPRPRCGDSRCVFRSTG